jgi:hypothetical protein
VKGTADSYTAAHATDLPEVYSAGGGAPSRGDREAGLRQAEQAESLAKLEAPRKHRAALVAIVVERMAGSQEPGRHTHIECNCDDRDHRRDIYDDGCFCPECAALGAVALGYPPTDTEPEKEGPDDSPQRCETCGRLITLRNTEDLEWGVTPDGALEELQHFETGLGFKRGEPKTPDDWRLFLLCVDAIADEHLPRVAAVIARSAS